MKVDGAPPQLARRRRGWLARVLLLVASLGIALFLGELMVRLAAALTHHVPLVVSDEYAGWALQPNLQDEIRAGDGGQYVISTDAEGHRLTRPAGEAAAADGPAVLVVGDSF